MLGIANFDELPEEEQAKLVQDYQDALAGLVKQYEEENKKNKTQISVMKNQMEIGFKELSKKIEKMKSVESVVKSFSAQIRESLMANKQALSDLKNDKNKSVVFKAVGNMTFSGNLSGGNVPVEDRIEGLNVIASRENKFLSALQAKATSSNVISWVAQANKDGAAGQTARGLASGSTASKTPGAGANGGWAAVRLGCGGAVARLSSGRGPGHGARPAPSGPVARPARAALSPLSQPRHWRGNFSGGAALATPGADGACGIFGQIGRNGMRLLFWAEQLVSPYALSPRWVLAANRGALGAQPARWRFGAILAFFTARCGRTPKGRAA